MQTFAPTGRAGRASGAQRATWVGSDYCVKFTALDAAKMGFATRLILEGCRGVELQPGDCQQALDQMRAAGVEII